MGFLQSIFYVENVGATVRFYEAAFGFKILYFREADGTMLGADPAQHDADLAKARFAALETGTTALSFAAASYVAKRFPGHAPLGEGAPFPPSQIVFVTETVQEDYKRAIAAGAREVEAPHLLVSGVLGCFLRDPNGLMVELVAPQPVKN